MIRCVLLSLIVAGLGAGCGGESGPKEVPVLGKVSFEGQPAGGVVLEFVPIGQTPGVGGGAVTRDDGSFEVRGRGSSRGLPAGEYAVTASRRRNADGTPADLRVSPIDSPAVETLDGKFTDRERTPLRAKVPEAGNASFEFILTPVPRK